MCEWKNRASKLVFSEVMEKTRHREKKSHKRFPIYHVLSRRRVKWKLNIVKAVMHLRYGDVSAEPSGLPD